MPSKDHSMTLYYRRTLPGSTVASARSGYVTTTISNGTSSLTSLSNLPMCTKDYKTLTDDIINFSGNRIPAKSSSKLPATFLETVTIISKPYQSDNSANMITATANYVDNGDSPITTIPYVNYTVTGASGKFSSYTNVKILYDNGKEQKRTVIIT